MNAARNRKYTPLLVPSWMVKQLERANMPPHTLLNLTELLKICSIEDVVSFYCLNTNDTFTDRVFGYGQPGHNVLKLYWMQRHLNALQKVVEMVPLYEAQANDRIFFDDKLSDKTPPHVLHIESLDGQVQAVAFIIQPGQLGGADQREAQHRLVREYVRQLYAFTDYAVLARDPLFERYLKCVTLNDVSHPV